MSGGEGHGGEQAEHDREQSLLDLDQAAADRGGRTVDGAARGRRQSELDARQEALDAKQARLDQAVEAEGSARAVVSGVIDAINAGERDAVRALVHPRVAWRPTLWSGASTFHGREGVGRWLDQFGPGIEHLRIEVAEIHEAASGALVLGVVHDTRDGGSFSARLGWTFEVEDGLVVDGRAYESWEEARRAAGVAPRD
jgi:ketosteroid isomerase-like protein